MGVVRGLLKGAVAAKLIDIARREASKPENQERARQLVRRVSQQVQQRRAGRSAQR